MTLEYELDSLDGVDESLKEHYAELKKDDDTVSYVLQLDEDTFKTTEDIDRIQSALQKERANHKETKSELRKFGALDPEGIQDKLRKLNDFGDIDPEGLQDKLDKFEEMSVMFDDNGNLKDEKTEELINARAEARIAKAEREVTKLQTQVKELSDTLGTKNTEIAGLKQDNTQRTIRSTIGEAIDSSDGFLPAAKKDALLIGESLFTLDEDGDIVAKDTSGINAGVTPSEWLKSVKSDRPYWWGDSKGGGTRPGAPGNNPIDGDNPWSKELWNFTQQAMMQKEDPEKAERMAKAAGSRIGAISPPA